MDTNPQGAAECARCQQPIPIDAPPWVDLCEKCFSIALEAHNA